MRFRIALTCITVAGACSWDPSIVTLSGYFVVAEETSSFLPCGSRGLPGYGVGYWVSWDALRSAAYRRSTLGPRLLKVLDDARRTTTDPAYPEGRGMPILFLRAQGELSS